MKKYLELKEIGKNRDYVFYQIIHQEFRNNEFNPIQNMYYFIASNEIELASESSPEYISKDKLLCCWGRISEKDKNLIKIPRGQVKVVLQAVEEYNAALNEYFKCLESKKDGDATEETINHPNHYGGKDNPYEAIKVIEAWNLGFNLGNTIKYVSRAGKKGDVLEDLQKAKWYLEREIETKKNGESDAR